MTWNIFHTFYLLNSCLFAFRSSGGRNLIGLIYSPCCLCRFMLDTWFIVYICGINCYLHLCYSSRSVHLSSQCLLHFILLSPDIRCLRSYSYYNVSCPAIDGHHSLFGTLFVELQEIHAICTFLSMSDHTVIHSWHFAMVRSDYIHWVVASSSIQIEEQWRSFGSLSANWSASEKL
jgi:hypothetical protein